MQKGIGQKLFSNKDGKGFLTVCIKSGLFAPEKYAAVKDEKRPDLWPFNKSFSTTNSLSEFTFMNSYSSINYANKHLSFAFMEQSNAALKTILENTEG